MVSCRLHCCSNRARVSGRSHSVLMLLLRVRSKLVRVCATIHAIQTQWCGLHGIYSYARAQGYQSALHGARTYIIYPHPHPTNPYPQKYRQVLLDGFTKISPLTSVQVQPAPIKCQGFNCEYVNFVGTNDNFCISLDPYIYYISKC